MTSESLLSLDDTAVEPAGLASSDNALLPSSPSPSANESLREAAGALGIPYWEQLTNMQPSAEFVERVPIAFARQYGMLAFRNESETNGSLLLAMSSPENWPQLDVVRRWMKRDVQPLLVPFERLVTAINRAYEQRDGQVAAMIQVLDRDDAEEDLESLAQREDLLDGRGSSPVIRLVNSILFEAVKARASDVHVQPTEDTLIVRQRIDGVLFDTLTVPKNCQEQVTSRLKILGRMNIAEKRLPQDGRATVQFGDRLVDLRISSLPTSFGERVVVRFLDKSARLYTLDELGIPPDKLTQFRRLIQRDHGILLATGPTGSGKSTTLYAALLEINSKTHNVLTLEDPIEYQLEGISQTQINQKKGLTFATGLRHVLRQDPDIIMVGEIRDQETAVMAIQSSLTGHLVFSTLHTNDAAGAVARLLDLGVEPYLVASSVIAVIAQRLVRKVCDNCRQPHELTEDEQVRFRAEAGRGDVQRLFRGSGCPACRHTGYLGRVGIFEILHITDAIRDLVQSHANAAQLRAQAMREGMSLLRDDGLMRAAAGLTTVEEVMRVTAVE